MIIFDANRCTGCGLCVGNCHEDSLALRDGVIHIDQVLCDACAQCIALCPCQALSWAGVPPVAYDHSLLPSPEQLMELFQERRSIRAFKDSPIEKDLLAEIVSCGVYAPTHNQVFKSIIVDDPALIAQLDSTILWFNNLIYRLSFRNRLVGILANLFGYGDEYRKSKPKLESAVQRGSAFSSTPAAIIIVTGNKNIALAEASAQYALANMMFYAQVKGLGACLWGNAPIFLDKHRGTRQRLKIQKQERIYGALFMGYPAIKFSNKVNGRKQPIQWNNQR